MSCLFLDIKRAVGAVEIYGVWLDVAEAALICHAI
jgi:hypothetical protein